MNKLIQKFIFFTVIFTCFSGLQAVKISKFIFLEPKMSHKQESVPNITVFIHGTKPPIPEAILAKINKGGFSFKSGLVPAEDVSEKLNLKKYIESICESGDNIFSFDNFYVFGWSGKLSSRERVKAAQDLYESLSKLVGLYQINYGTEPKVNLITHSHGGNLALNLAKVKSSDNKLLINKLILLACPVQKLTQVYLNDSIFEKIYSLYSSSDIIQVLDPQLKQPFDLKKSVKSIFSSRKFPTSSNLVQVDLNINGKGIGHLAFLEPYFGKILPEIIREIDSWKQEDSSEYSLNIFTNLKSSL